MKDRILLGLALIAIAILGCALLSLDPEVRAGMVKLGNELNTGGIILFFTFGTLGAAALAVKIWKMFSSHTIRDGKDGKVARAIIYKGQVVQIGSSEGIGITELMQMQAQIAAQQQKMMQVVGTSATAMQRLATLEAYYDDDEEDEPKLLEPPEEATLPNLVKYEDIKPYIPVDHALVGVDATGVITRGREIKALTWIVGGSGTGKTNSVCLRVEEDYQWGHRFLVIDPHWFKADSMYNAIKGYSDRFLMPVACETEDILKVLDLFLGEFKRRKAGARWEFPITILIDEVGSLTSDATEDEQEKAMIAKIKQVARICGQESRGFQMTGMYISQDAAGLAWLRKRAILVLAHQLLMMSERLLATNKNAEVARDMDNWPKGRTLVYGIGLEEGQRVVQQPVFRPRIVESAITSGVTSEFFQHPSGAFSGSVREVNGEAVGSGNSQNSQVTDITVVKQLREIGKRLKNGEDKTEIVKSYGLPWGRGTQELGATIDMIEEQMREAGEL